MACSERTGLGLPFPTKWGHHTKSTVPKACVDAYQMLPESVLAVRTPLVFLDWSTNVYHPFDLSLNLPRGGFTNLYHRGLGTHIDSDL